MLQCADAQKHLTPMRIGVILQKLFSATQVEQH